MKTWVNTKVTKARRRPQETKGAYCASGPGLESAYEACLLRELQQRILKVWSQVLFPVIYNGLKLDVGYGIDLLVEDSVIVEIECVEAIQPVHKAQLLSYLRLTGRSLGLIINFHVEDLKNGIRRVVNGYEWRSLSSFYP